MPERPLKKCPWCGNRYRKPPCLCRAERVATYDRQRGADRQFYSQARWRHVRRVKLLQEPLCRFCRAQGRDRPATVVDHVIPRSERPELAYDMDNLRSLCVPCHNRRTRLNEGGKD